MNTATMWPDVEKKVLNIYLKQNKVVIFLFYSDQMSRGEILPWKLQK